MKFTYENPTRVYFGEDQIAALAKEIPIKNKVLVIYGGGSIKFNGVYQQIKDALIMHEWEDFGGVQPNPQYDTLMKAVKKVKSGGFDYLLAVGGGSVVDGTKFIAAAACYQGSDPWDILQKRIEVKKALPIGCVLTLPATGSETNSGSVISRAYDKLDFGSPLVRPRFAVLDPQVTLSLSPRQIANGIADAYVHVMEQYLTYPVNAKVQDRFAEGLLLTLLEEGPKALADPMDLKVRANIMWTATLALNGLIGAGVPQDWTTHTIGHELTGLYGIDHGRSLTIVLPAVMKHRREQKRDKLVQYGERVFGITSGTHVERIEKVIDKTVAFFQSISVPTSLGDVGLGVDAIDQVIESLRQHGREGLSERGDIDPDTCRIILEKAL